MRFTPLEELGSSTFATVYKAKDAQSGSVVALKVLSRALQSDPQAGEIFRKEASMTARLNHPNIIALLEYGAEGGRPFLVTEYFDGQSIRRTLRLAGKFPPADALYIVGQVALGLAHAHGRGMIHRDVKPSNILLGGYTPGRAAGLPPVQVKILDFGLGKSIAQASRVSTAFVGTPHYISPEQIRGEALDATTDLYSLGVTLFEMLTGTVPFLTGDVIRHHLNTPPRAPSELAFGLPASLDPLVLRCLAKTPADRYPTADALFAELEKARANVNQLP